PVIAEGDQGDAELTQLGLGEPGLTRQFEFDETGQLLGLRRVHAAVVAGRDQLGYPVLHCRHHSSSISGERVSERKRGRRRPVARKSNPPKRSASSSVRWRPSRLRRSTRPWKPSPV